MVTASTFSIARAVRRGADRRLDDRARAGVDQLGRALLLGGWRAREALFGPAPAEDEGDSRLELAVAVLLADRALATALRSRAERHEAALRLRRRAQAEAEHARDFSFVDPLDGLALDRDGGIAAAAVTLREAEAATVDPFGGPAVTLGEVDGGEAGVLIALGAVLRRERPDAEQPAFDREIEAVLAALVPTRTPDDAAAALADALDRAGRLNLSELLDALAGGHVALWTAGAARLLGRSPDRLEAAMGDPGIAPALARLLAPDPLAAARLLLLLARTASGDDDRAGAIAAAWIDRYGELTEAAADRLMAAALRAPAYAAAIARAEAWA